MFSFTRYVCPACKTKNKPSLKYCRKCGQWLLDTIHESKQVKISPFKPIVAVLKFIFLGTICLVLIAVIFAIASSNGNQKGSINKNKQTLSTQQKPGSETVLGVGETASLQTLDITVNSVRATSGTRWEKPRNGMFIIVNISIVNSTNRPSYFSSLLQASLQDSEGYKYDQIIYSGTKGSLNGQIGPGRKIRGKSHLMPLSPATMNLFLVKLFPVDRLSGNYQG